VLNSAIISNDISFNGGANTFELTNGKTYRISFSSAIDSINPIDSLTLGLFQGANASPESNTTALWNGGNIVTDSAIINCIPNWDGSNFVRYDTTSATGAYSNLDFTVNTNNITINTAGFYKMSVFYQGSQSSGGSEIVWVVNGVQQYQRLTTPATNSSNSFNAGNILVLAKELNPGDVLQVEAFAGSNLQQNAPYSYVNLEKIGNVPNMSQNYDILYTCSSTDNYSLATTTGGGSGSATLSANSRLVIQ